LGYLRAADRYDSSKGASFRGFCAVRIRGAVLDELRRWDWAPRSVHKHNRRITQVTMVLTERLEREPTCAEVARALGIEVGELVAMQVLSQPRTIVSFDDVGENGRGEESIPLLERLADPQVPSPDAAVHDAENRRTLLKCLGALPKSQGIVIILHYLQSVPLRDVAALMKVTPSRVSQLHHQALDRLRQSWKRTEAFS
jgi:RNA polymerase sigma factor for flagellar operon FliA